MRRKLRALQNRIVSVVQQNIESGHGKHKELVRAVVNEVQNDSSISLLDLTVSLAAHEVSAAKQKLRADGLIEIGDGTQAKLVSDLHDADVATISSRQWSNLHGGLKASIKFHHRQGRHDDCRMLLRSYSAMAETDAKALAEELNITF